MSTMKPKSQQRWEDLATAPAMVNAVRENTQEHTGRTASLQVWHGGHKHAAGITVGMFSAGGLLDTGPAQDAHEATHGAPASPGIVLAVEADRSAGQPGLVEAPPKVWQSYNLTCGTCGRGLGSVPGADLVKAWWDARVKGSPRIALP